MAACMVVMAWKGTLAVTISHSTMAKLYTSLLFVTGHRVVPKASGAIHR